MRRTSRGAARPRLTVPRRTLPLLAVALALAALAVPAGATSYVMVSDRALAEQAAAVVEAQVLDAAPSALEGGIPATEYRIEVSRVLAGSVPGTTLVVRMPGG